MSHQKSGLSSPPVVAGVFVVLAVLVVVNVRTFAPRRARGPAAEDASGVRVQAHPALPVDLDEVMRPSRVATDLGAPVQGPRPDVARDPFTSAALLQLPAAPTSPRAAARPVERRAPSAEPVCEAVMLGAGRPAALIDGRLVGVGDQVRQYVVERIDARGVSLGGTRKLFLPVGIIPSGDGAHSVVTGSAPGARVGRAGLVEYAESERN
ncbi:MAG: hypothetical protein IPK64_14210 [bacterium]|nr:hypothetical protein [bacterium]